ELRVTLDLAKAGASRVRAGMNGKVAPDGKSVVINAFDFVPKADLAVELLGDGAAGSELVAYRAPHALTADDIPMDADPKFDSKVSSEEPDYLLLPLRNSVAPEASSSSSSGKGEAASASKGGIDLAIVVDTSAATESGALAIARNLTSALLAHLGPEDRAAL